MVALNVCSSRELERLDVIMFTDVNSTSQYIGLLTYNEKKIDLVAVVLTTLKKLKTTVIITDPHDRNIKTKE